MFEFGSAKPEAYGAVPPYAWTGGVLEVGAVRQVLASIISCWPIFGWTPALLPRLLGSNPTSLPGEPVEACSAICLLVLFLSSLLTEHLCDLNEDSKKLKSDVVHVLCW